MDFRTHPKLLKKKKNKNLTLLPLQIILKYFGETMSDLFLSYKLNSSLCHFRSHTQNTAHPHIKYVATNSFSQK